MVVLRQHRAAPERAGRLERHAQAAHFRVGNAVATDGEIRRRREPGHALCAAGLRDRAGASPCRPASAAGAPDVDPRRIVVFGASMGSNYAPLVAAGEDVAGVIVWGGGATTWFERMLRFERSALELGGTDPQALADEVNARAAYFARYLLKGEIAGRDRSQRPEARRSLARASSARARRPLRPAVRVSSAGAAAELGRCLEPRARAGARAAWRVRLVRVARRGAADREHRQRSSAGLGDVSGAAAARSSLHALREPARCVSRERRQGECCSRGDAPSSTGCPSTGGERRSVGAVQLFVVPEDAVFVERYATRRLQIGIRFSATLRPGRAAR